MNILSHREAAVLIEREQKTQNIELDDEARKAIIHYSGRLDRWIEALISHYKQSKKLDEKSIYEYFVENDSFKTLLKYIPSQQHQFFINPQLANENEFIKLHKFIDENNRIFSPLFLKWIAERKMFDSVVKQGDYLTASEEKVLRVLYLHISHIVQRDDIAQALWGNIWLEKYSEYMIDKTIYRLRGKILRPYKIITLKNRGYVLIKENQTITIPSDAFFVTQPEGITPHSEYFSYMNTVTNVRKTLSDLFDSMYKENVCRDIQSLLKSSSPLHILVINSFSFDNIDAMQREIIKRGNKQDKILFTNFNDAALKIHQKRVEELKLINTEVLYDDIRTTRLAKNSFDLVINDFRLNFNSHHQQNISAMKNIRSVLKEGGNALISVVVDPRFESDRYGIDQEKAPINKYAPSTFIFTENLRRFCFTIPYYKQLFERCGFNILKEFDIEEGRSWYKKHPHIPNQEPAYRRFLLR